MDRCQNVLWIISYADREDLNAWGELYIDGHRGRSSRPSVVVHSGNTTISRSGFDKIRVDRSVNLALVSGLLNGEAKTLNIDVSNGTLVSFLVFG